MPVHEPPPAPAQAGLLQSPAEVAIIAAVAANRVIGNGLHMPWRLPADLRHFRALTTGHSVIMGRRTWQSLPRALPDRQNVVVSSNPLLAAGGAVVVPTLASALAAVDRPAPVFIIGGAVLYDAALPIAHTLYLTEIAHAYAGDVLFPDYAAAEWQEVAREPVAAIAGQPAYAFVRYRRIAAPGPRPG